MKRPALATSFASATVLGGGFLIVWAIGLVWVFSIVEQAMESDERIEYTNQIYVDGSAEIWRRSRDEYLYGSNTAPDPANRELVRGPKREATEAMTEESGEAYRVQAEAYVSPKFDMSSWERLSWNYERLLTTIDHAADPPVVWYFIRDARPHGLGYFVGYDSESYRCVGYLDREGFSSEEPPEERRFPLRDRTQYINDSRVDFFGWGDFQDQVRFSRQTVPAIGYLLSEDAIYKVDLPNRAVEKLFEGENLETLSQYREIAWETPGLRKFGKKVLVVRTPETLLRVDGESGELLGELPIPDAINGTQFNLCPLGFDLFVMVDEGRRYEGADLVWESRIYWFDGDGELIDEAFEKRSTPSSGLRLSEPLEAIGVFCAMPVPGPGILLASVGKTLDECIGKKKPLSEALVTMLGALWPSYLFCIALAVLLGWLTMRRQRRYGDDRVWAWVIFVALLGLPGYVGYLVHRRWPVLETCAKCEAKAPRDREQCASCGSEFPAPELRGTEVFA